MQADLEDAEAQTEILALLRNVAHSDEGTAALLADGVVTHVKATMQHHAASPAVQTEGLAMLGNVAYNCEMGHKPILQEGAVGLAMRVLDEHMMSEMVVRAALIMLWKA